MQEGRAGMPWPRILELLAGLVGLHFMLMGVACFAMLATGSVIEGHAGVAMGGVASLVAAAPALATPFSTRIAKRLLMFALSVFAAAVLWRVFTPQALHVSWTVKAAVLAFAALLAVRVMLALRMSRTSVGDPRDGQ